MKNKFFFIHSFIIIICFLKIWAEEEDNNVVDFEKGSYYYEEKYFRILTNNYDTIDPGNAWFYNKEEQELGFRARKDFGSLILLKDWSLYNFKLIKILFKPCSFEYINNKCNVEMWLVHTKDNGYYPPGRRIFIKQNFFIIVVPFVKTDNSNPAIDSIFDSLRFAEYAKNPNQNKKIYPKKPVKLYQIIQNQPSFLVEGKYNEEEILFLVFSQYHFISKENYDYLNKFFPDDTQTTDSTTVMDEVQSSISTTVMDEGQSSIPTTIATSRRLESSGKNMVIFDDAVEYPKKIFRNVRNKEEVDPKVTLMSYSKAKYLENLLIFIIIFLL